jgi:amino acid adenylation domain-containing protein
MRRLDIPGLTLRRFEDDSESAKLDLIVWMVEAGDGVHAAFEYNTDLFDAGTVTRLLSHFQHLLTGVVCNSEQRLSELPLMSESELQQLVYQWNETAAGELQPQTINTQFEEQAERTPEAVAIVYEAAQLSYRELNERANQLAHHLRGLGVGPEVRVGLCLERSLEMIVSLLAVLKAGGAYVPLDPTYPQERLAFMLADAAVAVLLTQSDLMASLPVSKEMQVVSVDSDWELIKGQRTDNPESGVGPENLAYVIYTSGSTGRPKGVMVTHGNVTQLFAAIGEQIALRPGGVWTLFHSYAFDFSVWELWGALLHGSALVITPFWVTRNPGAFLQLLERHGVTVLSQTPSAFAQLLGVVERVEVLWRELGVRLLVLGGEALPRELGTLLTAAGAPAWNFYGPTEATVWAAIRRLDEGREVIALGRPLAHTQLYILDGHGQVAAVGVVGELHIGGAGLARGYHGRAELTAEKFVPDPFSRTPGARLYCTGDLVRYLNNGELEFLGRVDHQVKLRGYRIELGEIEAVLKEQFGVREALVIAKEEPAADRRLVAYLVTEEGIEVKTSDLRQALREKLPEYMLPVAFVQLAELPLTPNGKIDRRALPATDGAPSGDREYLWPRTPVEEVLAGIFGDVLKLAKVGVDENFFELGGHSLLATRLISKVREAFHVEIPLRSVFESSTVAGLALIIEELLYAEVAAMNEEDVAAWSLQEDAGKERVTHE